MANHRRSKTDSAEPPACARSFTGAALKMISFPLGGIGTGTIGLGGRGELRDWEIFNAPRKGYVPPFSMPYLFCRAGRTTVARVLERRLLPPHHNAHGLPPEQLAGLPRLAEATFTGSYPFARIAFADADLPVNVRLEAFNPMVPADADASAIPAAVLIYRLTNRTRGRVTGSVAISMANTVGLSACCGGGGLGGNVNAFRKGRGLSGISMELRGQTPSCQTTAKRSQSPEPGEVGFGSEALVTTARHVSYATDFDEPGHAFDKAQKVWDDYRADGRLDGPRGRTKPSADGKTRIGMICAEYTLAPGGSTEIVFVIAWSFPHRLADWIVPAGHEARPVANHYARRFPDAWTAARYVVANLPRLRERTLAFERALFASTLPPEVLDAVSSQMSILRTNTTMWLDSPPDEPDGRIFAFEGCSPDRGCCPMNCTHVWNYEQSLAHLFPALERTMRRTDYQENVQAAGAMSFRTTVPLGAGLPLWRENLPAADGQFGTVVKVHREWRLSGDDEWLKGLWPAVKRSVEFAWKGLPNGGPAWDADADGVMEGVQHNTYDIEFHGPNTMCGSLYLAGLTAAAEMAQAVGDGPAAGRFRELAVRGAAKLDHMLFNGEYYIQKVVPGREPDQPVFAAGRKTARPKYQYGFGCLSDQLLGQWAAHVAGLGYVLPAGHVRKAIAAVFRHNFKADLSAHESVQRTYAVNDEAGLLLCTWPRGRREAFPFIYSDEVWTGIEYQVAAHLIYEGMIEEGLAIVRAVRARHDGVARNPWNEFECGDHYARAMSSWSLLLALSGQRYDGRSAELTVAPAVTADDFRCLFTAAEGYGTFAQRRLARGWKVTVDVLDGTVALSALSLAVPARRATARLNGEQIEATVETSGEHDSRLRLPARRILRAGDSLDIRLT